MFSNKIVVDIIEYIDNNLYSKITINDLQYYFHYNKDYIMRLFKREINTTILDYINKKRIYNSLNTIQNTNNSIINISINYGFSSLEYYSETFKKIIGISPIKFRNYKRYNSTISDKEEILVQENITNLYSLINKVNLYSKNIKKDKYVKELRLFK